MRAPHCGETERMQNSAAGIDMSCVDEGRFWLARYALAGVTGNAETRAKTLSYVYFVYFFDLVSASKSWGPAATKHKKSDSSSVWSRTDIHKMDENQSFSSFLSRDSFGKYVALMFGVKRNCLV